MKVPSRLVGFLVVAASLCAACTSPVDCNVPACHDCACVDGTCQCADGWSGDACLTSFCHNRTDCGGHGSCEMTISNVSCHCDAGWTGERCTHKACNLTCAHGGAPDAKCTTCEGCAGAWTGLHCDSWNTSVPIATLLNQLHQIFNSSQTALDKTLAVNPLCRQSQECAGWGVNMDSGQVSSLPIVQLSYPDSARTWKGYREPAEATFVPFDAIQPSFVSQTFPEVADFVAYASTLLGNGDASAGLFNQDWTAVLATFFQRPEDAGLSSVQGLQGLYKITLDQPTGMVLDKFFQRAIASLPPDAKSAANKQMFDVFRDRFGTDLVVAATLGGLVEFDVSWQYVLRQNLSDATLLAQAKIEFTNRTNLGGWQGQLDPNYLQRRQTESLFCLGGDPSLCTSQKIEQWVASIVKDPRVLSLSALPLSQIIAEPQIATALQEANSQYFIAQKAAWDHTNKCPRCPADGSCAPPSTSCDCPQVRPPLGQTFGHTCECADGHVGPHCLPWRSSITATLDTAGGNYWYPATHEKHLVDVSAASNVTAFKACAQNQQSNCESVFCVRNATGALRVSCQPPSPSPTIGCVGPAVIAGQSFCSWKEDAGYTTVNCTCSFSQ